MPILYSAQHIPGHINISGDSPWFNKRLQLGRTCIKGPKFCLSASNSERYLHKAREQLLHSLISFQPVHITVTYSCVPNLKVTVTKWWMVIFRMLLHAVWHVLKIDLTALQWRSSSWPSRFLKQLWLTLNHFANRFEGYQREIQFITIQFGCKRLLISWCLAKSSLSDYDHHKGRTDRQT